MAPTYAASHQGYLNLWNQCQIQPAKVAEVHAVCGRILGNRQRFETVEASTGVPWFWQGAIQSRESDLDFGTYFGNGDRVIGNGRRTTDVPASRGPFSTWEQGAMDSLRMEGLLNLADWSIPACLYRAEAFNGWGYYSVGENSPYVWAGTNLQQSGKYVGDGEYSRTAWDTQLGVAAIFKGLQGMNVDARLT